MQTSKSPCDVAMVAYTAAKKALTPYTHPKSPKKFTQPQLMTCLVMKAYFQKDYRGIIQIISEHDRLRRLLDLTKDMPHYTTLQKAAHRLLRSRAMRRLLKEIIVMGTTTKKEKRINNPTVLFDSTGFDPIYASRYFVFRKTAHNPEKRRILYRNYPKLSISTLARSFLIVAGFTTRGPSTDLPYFARLFQETVNLVVPSTIIADMGYDRESHHVLGATRGVRTIIPALRRSRVLPKTPYRKAMATLFPHQTYGLRWLVETVMSMLKRNLGSIVLGRGLRSQSRELFLKIFTHNCMVV